MATSDRGLALLAEALESPDDDAPRLVYADWLEERDHPFADVIRMQCEAAKLPARDRPPLEMRVAALVRKHAAEWIQPIEIWLAPEPHFERGIAKHVYGATSKYVQKANQALLLAALSLYGASVTVLRGPSVKLPTAATLAWTSALRWYDCQADDAQLAGFARSPHVARLSSLTFEKVRCTNEGLFALATSKYLTRVKHFALPAPVHLGAYKVAGVIEVLERLPIEHLDLTGVNSLRLDELVSAPAVGRLRRFEITTDRVAHLAASTQLTSLEHLSIDTIGPLQDEPIETLLANPVFANLRSFELKTFGRQLGPATLGRLRARFGDNLTYRATGP